MHSARVGSGEDIIGQSATRGSLLLSIRSLYQSCMSVRMNAILGDRKQVVLMSPEEIETQTHSVQAAVTNERRFPSADSFSPKKKINVKQRANETENNHHRSTFSTKNYSHLLPIYLSAREITFTNLCAV